MLPDVQLGDTVLFQYGQEQWPAIVTKVWGPSCVNLCVMPHYGLPYSTQSSALGSGHEQWQHRPAAQPAPVAEQPKVEPAPAAEPAPQEAPHAQP